MFMNRCEIEDAYNRTYACPNVCKGVRLLYRLMEAVDAQSDGWAHWPAPSRSAAKLVEAIKSRTLTDAQLKAAVTPIRRMVTVQTAKQKKYGNTFTFNVDEALND